MRLTGIRIYLSVGLGGALASSFEINTLAGSRDADGTAVIEAVISNTGARALDMSGELYLKEGPAGLSAGPFDATLGTTLAIDESGIVRVPLSKELPAGPWTVSLTMTSGLISETVSAVITFPEAGKGEPVEAMSGFDLLTLGLLIAAFVFLIGLLILMVIRVRRKKRLFHKKHLLHSQNSMESGMHVPRHLDGKV